MLMDISVTFQCSGAVLTGTEWKYELSAGYDWDASDPKSMNALIETQVSDRSPETSGSYQLRRIIRFGKFYTKTHAARLNRKFPGGLVATALFIEAYVPVEGARRSGIPGNASEYLPPLQISPGQRERRSSV